MNSIEFVKNIINELVANFPSIQCRYQFKVESNTHFIEVLPNSVYTLEEEYGKAEIKATLAFIDQFPQEGICFITDDSIVKLENPIYTKAGELFLQTLLPTFALPDNVFLSEWISFKSPFNVSIGQNQSLYELLTSFESAIAEYKYWTYLPNDTAPIPAPIVLSEQEENELPLAA